MSSPFDGFAPEDIQRIEAECPIATLEYHKTLGSTNDRALVLARDEQVVLPALVLAGQQTAGRGRGANRWSSSTGALTFSLVIEPPSELPVERLSILSLITGLAVCKTLNSKLPAGHDIGLKWPNDVFLDGGKVCGILAESVAAPRYRVVMGVGLNVNNEVSVVDTNARYRPASLAQVAGHQHLLSEILCELLLSLGDYIKQIARDNQSWIDDYEQYCLLRAKTITIRNQQETVTGECQGIASDGALLVAHELGVKRIYSGTVDMG
jgi:BirA family biotin operon repressor/biotin-[acetyl-CoA-carboxylase] ligase